MPTGLRCMGMDFGGSPPIKCIYLIHPSLFAEKWSIFFETEGGKRQNDPYFRSDKKVILTDGLGGAGPETAAVMTDHLPPPVSTCAIPMKRLKMIPPVTERLMLYVRQDGERVYTPLHLTPPSLVGLLNAVRLSNFILQGDFRR